MNAEARALRDERDALHTKKKELIALMGELKKQRDELVKEMREHKKRRNELQRKAKELIQLRRDKRGKMMFNLPKEVEVLDATIQELMERQETTPLTLEMETKLIDEIRKKRKEYNTMRDKLETQEHTVGVIESLNDAIDEFFKTADAEHEKVLELSLRTQELHEKISPLVNEIAYMINEANKKHENYLKTRDRANTVHERILKMRSTIIREKLERRKEREEAQNIIKEHRKAVRRLLEDEKKLDELTEQAIERLKAKGKVTL